MHTTPIGLWQIEMDALAALNAFPECTAAFIVGPLLRKSNSNFKDKSLIAVWYNTLECAGETPLLI